MNTVTPHPRSESATTPASKSPLLRRVSAAAITLAATAVVLVLSAGAASAQISNPLDGVTPDLGVFGPAFNSVWARVVGGIWGAALAASTVKLIMAIYKMRSMRSAGMPTEMAEAGQDAKIAGIAVGCLASVGIIVGAIIYITSGGN
ncbi:hypothetical protein [Rhodococcus qingshengii]|uniref:hypothetical protein n=1 Tax=Rhodococcus qingshengii TaxID=334542 RepID=UPI00237CCAAA|nr:hypothetical protein [Rhodococcus qingshengii]WCT06208.1 hypothetical protein PI247_31875 [Rhodococcus qingshengii]